MPARPARRSIVDRRNFLKRVAGCGAASLAYPAAGLLGEEAPASYSFGLHPFIEAHPEAVFIRRTNVASQADSNAIRRESFELAGRIFSLRSGPGASLAGKFAIKPNLTSAKHTGMNHAIVTDPYVVEGFVDALKKATIPAERIYIREGLMVSQPGTGFIELAKRSGTHYGDDDSRAFTTKECPGGVVFRRTKYVGPFNYPDSYLINIAKFKSHSMGLTLCTKNLQGTNAQPYIRFCGGIQKAIASDFQPDAEKHVEDLYEKHARAEMPRWRTEKGLWMEMWIQRTLDHYALIRPSIGLNVIEGVYAQDGDGFNGGPGADGLPQIFPTNMLIFGKDAIRVDIIGHWLGGHEPGNFGLFHIAKERGMSSALNPRNIPVYEWGDEGPKLTRLDHLPRTLLKAPYLEKPDEARFHMCDEPFSYPSERPSAELSGSDRPNLVVLGQSTPRPGLSSVVVEYSVPADGPVALDLYDESTRKVAVLSDSQISRWIHVAEWSVRNRPRGTYYCRMRFAGTDQIVPFTLRG